MEKLISIYRELYDAGVTLIDRPLNFSNGTNSAVIHLQGYDTYGIFIDSRNMLRSEEAVTIAHEAGHIATGSTHTVCCPCDIVAKHENRANRWAIKKLVPKGELEKAMKNGITEVWDLAEHFNVTEDFMKKAFEYYDPLRIMIEE